MLTFTDLTKPRSEADLSGHRVQQYQHARDRYAPDADLCRSPS
jgi:hypothetical protein